MSSSRLGPEARVNSKHLSEHRGQVVRLTAKVLNLVGDTATVEASDGGEDMHIEGTYVEIIGNVKEDLSIRALTSINLGNSLDMNAVNAVVEYSHSSKGSGVLA
ncbi:Replication factor A protein 3 [Vanrija pseudolonga]|uniref:Replication factor A protein 3 n=1 Tax=Vanrija pseudolonga TaxID=143232 RepID=A0AAF0Y869_9TREE|nr:Replication factor A protein 3 [Vanrija pseudolonga]